ncbi:hypothetical protein [Mycobacteroides abscessus]|uniref:hypothetical protein n=1 Tax=Mycobacteroides abscessus TaxID=36809 RepID=UPI0012FFDBB1
MRKKREEYLKQLSEGIDEMEARVDELRKEIHWLMEKKEALVQVNRSIKKELIEMIYYF